MNKTVTKYLIIIFAYLAVLYPLWVRFQNVGWSSDNSLLLNLFPFFGLTAFSLLWLHAVSGVFEPWLRRQFNFDRFVRVTSLIIFICIILHPLLLFIGFNFKLTDILSYGPLYIRLGVIGWLLLITYDIGKALKNSGFFVKNWNLILFISTIGFLLTFFHSRAIGGDLQMGPLKVIWNFYGVTAILSTIYTYGIKRILK